MTEKKAAEVLTAFYTEVMYHLGVELEEISPVDGSQGTETRDKATMSFAEKSEKLIKKYSKQISKENN